MARMDGSELLLLDQEQFELRCPNSGGRLDQQGRRGTVREQYSAVRCFVCGCSVQVRGDGLLRTHWLRLRVDGCR